MRDILTAFAALFAIALITLMVGPYFVDWDSQRLRVATALESRTGIAVRIGGPLRITLLPSPELDAGEIELGPADAPLARMERLSFSLSPAALLSGRITFTTARADRAVVSQAAIRALTRSPEAASANPEALLPEKLAQIGFDHLELKAARLVERIEPGVPLPQTGSGYDVTLEAPGLNGPFRLQISDPALGRDFRAQIGKLERGRARMKGVLEDKQASLRLSLDGWFATPGIGGRPVFDGAATFSGNPVLGKAGPQLPFTGTARLMAHTDHVIADPVNLAWGSGDNALQLAGQSFVDLKGTRPLVQVKLAAKRFDAAAFLLPDEVASPGAAPGFLLDRLGEIQALALPFDLALDLSIGAIQVPGASLQDVVLKAGLSSGTLVLETASATLPGATRAEFQRGAVSSGLPVDGDLDIAAGELQTLIGWIRGADAALNFPASARLRARLTGDAAGVKAENIRLESPAGILSGTGEFLPREAGKRPLPRLVLDLAADRFDTRVLAALDPLRPIPGLELTTRLTVRRLALDGTEMGGLQVALDRDGATATLRQLRLTGRNGEELTLSGTASGTSLQMTAKVDAERLGDIAQLSRALLPGPLTEAFLGRAASLEPAIAVANLRFVTQAGDAVWDVMVDGKLGGTALSGRSHSSLKGNDLHVRLDGTLTNPDSGQLAGQLSGLAFAAQDVPGRITITAEGNPRRLISGAITGSLAGAEMAFEGGWNPFRATPLEGRFSLVLRDLAPLAKVLGRQDLATLPGQGFTLRSRLAAERAKVTFGGVEARLGTAPVTGEVSVDLARGGQLAGQLRLETVALESLLAPIIGAHWPVAASGWSREKFGDPLPLPFPGDLWIEAKEALLPGGARLTAPQFVLRFAPGSVAIDGFEARSSDTRIAGSLALLRQQQRVDLAGRLEFARLPLGLLAGRVSGEIPFSSSGTTPLELVSSLSGAGKIALEDLVVPAADPLALARVTALSLDALAPLDENRIGGLLDAEIRKGELRIPRAAWPLGLLNGQIRVGGTTKAEIAPQLEATSVTPTFVVDLIRREAEARFTFAQTSLPNAWRGAVPEFTLVLGARHDARIKEAAPQRNLQVASLVNGFLAMAIHRDLERAEAFEADLREREAQLRRQRGDAFAERRAREILDAEAATAAETLALQRRAQNAAELERQRELAISLEKEARAIAEKNAAELDAQIRARLAEEKQRPAEEKTRPAEEKTRPAQDRSRIKEASPPPQGAPLNLMPRAPAPPG